MVKEMNSDKIEFDTLKMIQLIESDTILNDIFRDKCDITYNNIRVMVKENRLSGEIYKSIHEIFNKIIIKNPSQVKKYTSIILNSDNKIPKHYGKRKILNDIKETKNKSELDVAMLRLNDLRNIYAKLKNRGIKDKINGTSNLSKSDCRDIVAAVRIIENKLHHILNKRNNVK